MNSWNFSLFFGEFRQKCKCFILVRCLSEAVHIWFCRQMCIIYSGRRRNKRTEQSNVEMDMCCWCYRLSVFLLLLFTSSHMLFILDGYVMASIFFFLFWRRKQVITCAIMKPKRHHTLITSLSWSIRLLEYVSWHRPSSRDSNFPNATLTVNILPVSFIFNCNGK